MLGNKGLKPGFWPIFAFLVGLLFWVLVCVVMACMLCGGLYLVGEGLGVGVLCPLSRAAPTRASQAPPLGSNLQCKPCYFGHCKHFMIKILGC